jgi:arabinogalactan oligomer/maltooligosaccharide transport system permease protein
MSAAQDVTARPVAEPRTVERRRRRGKGFREDWWRHVVGIVACVFALFPVAYIVSAAFNDNDALSGAAVIPQNVTLHNFGQILHNADAPYVSWYLNTLWIALVTATFTVLLGAMAAFAFSRFRFRGRRMGMLFLLLIQMFPQLLLIVAIYLIVLHTGDVFSTLGLNSRIALVCVYLGGAMGVNTWLLKGFFDSIPSELDESARVDGATAAQVFWGVVLPLAAPVLAVVGLFSFVFTVNEFIIASVLLSTQDKLPLLVGMRGYIDQQYGQHWGPFAAGVLLASIPAVVLFAFLQRFIVGGLTQGSVKG